MKTKRLNSRELTEKLLKGKEVFLFCEYEEACLRISFDSNGKRTGYTKFKGEQEFKTHPESGVLQQVLLDPVEISESDYNSQREDNRFSNMLYQKV